VNIVFNTDKHYSGLIKILFVCSRTVNMAKKRIFKYHYGFYDIGVHFTSCY